MNDSITDSLHSAASRGDVEALTRLLDSGATPIDSRDPADQSTALISAARRGHTAALSLLCRRGADVHARGRDELDALLHAVLRRDRESSSVLLDAGADANVRTAELRTALAVASANDDAHMVALLLRHGANASVFATAEKDDVCGTHLVQACLAGSLSCARLFVQAGLDPNAPTSSGCGPLWALVQAGHFDAVKCLIAVGADADRLDPRLGTPLMLAAARGHALIAAFLAALHSGSVRRTDAQGRTPLMHAAAAGHAATVLCLIDRGAPLDSTDRSGFTALMLAAQRGHADTVRALLAAGASAAPAVKLSVFKKLNALTLAKSGGHADIVSLLQQAVRGAKKKHAVAAAAASKEE